MANKIYFPNFYNESYVVYSLANGRNHALAGGFSDNKSYQLQAQDTGIWIKPFLGAASSTEVVVVERTRDCRMELNSKSNTIEFGCKETADKRNEHDQLYDSRPPSVRQTHLWLLICDGDNFQRHTFFRMSQNQFHKRIIPEMRNKHIWCCSYGWLVLVDVETYDCCLLHLTSMKTIWLPQLEKLEYSECILSRPPTDPQCYVLFIASSEKPFVFCKLGDSKFIKQAFQDEEGVSLGTVTTYGEKIYGCFSNRDTLVHDFERGRLECKQGMEKKLPSPRPGFYDL